MKNFDSSMVRDVFGGGGPFWKTYTLGDSTTESEEDTSDTIDTDNAINEDASDNAFNEQSYSSEDPSNRTTSYSKPSTIETQIQTSLFFSLKRIFRSIYDFMLDLEM